jgi:hypothetical protein
MKIIWDAISKFISPIVILTIGCVILGAVGTMYMSSCYVTTEAYAKEQNNLLKQIQIGDTRTQISNLDIRSDYIKQQLWNTKQARKKDRNDIDLQERINELNNSLNLIEKEKLNLNKQIDNLNYGGFK